MKAILQEDGVEVDYEIKLVIFTTQAKIKNTLMDSSWDAHMSVLSNADYNRLAANRPQLAPLELKPGEAAYVLPDYLIRAGRETADRTDHGREGHLPAGAAD